MSEHSLQAHKAWLCVHHRKQGMGTCVQLIADYSKHGVWLTKGIEQIIYNIYIWMEKKKPFRFLHSECRSCSATCWFETSGWHAVNCMKLINFSLQRPQVCHTLLAQFTSMGGLQVVTGNLIHHSVLCFGALNRNLQNLNWNSNFLPITGSI